jgi:hypothetical protein
LCLESSPSNNNHLSTATIILEFNAKIQKATSEQQQPANNGHKCELNFITLQVNEQKGYPWFKLNLSS